MMRNRRVISDNPGAGHQISCHQQKPSRGGPSAATDQTCRPWRPKEPAIVQGREGAMERDSWFGPPRSPVRDLCQPMICPHRPHAWRCARHAPRLDGRSRSVRCSWPGRTAEARTASCRWPAPKRRAGPSPAETNPPSWPRSRRALRRHGTAATAGALDGVAASSAIEVPPADQHCHHRRRRSERRCHCRQTSLPPPSRMEPPAPMCLITPSPPSC